MQKITSSQASAQPIGIPVRSQVKAGKRRASKAAASDSSTTTALPSIFTGTIIITLDPMDSTTA